MVELLLVARREYLFNVRRPAFLFASLGAPIITVVGILIITAIAIHSESNLDEIGTVGYVDQAGVVTDALDQPDFFAAYPTPDTAEQALSAGEIGAYFILPPDYRASGTVRLYSRAGFPEALEDTINAFLVANLGAELNDSALIARLQEPITLTIHTLDNDRRLSEIGFLGVFLTPFVLVMVLFLAVQISATYLMAGVAEEKANRMIEMLITSVTPLQLLFGKVLGLGLLGLTQLAIWLAAGLVVLIIGQGSEIFAGLRLPLDLLLFALLYFVLGYLLFASLLGGLGAVAGSEQESRQYAGILSMLLTLPFIFLFTFLLDPNGTIPTVLTLLPFSAPTAAIMRMAFGAIPPWQIAVSLTLLALTDVIVIWGAARVFRWSLLRYGQKFRLRDVLRAFQRSAHMETVAAGEPTR